MKNEEKGMEETNNTVVSREWQRRVTKKTGQRMLVEPKLEQNTTDAIIPQKTPNYPTWGNDPQVGNHYSKESNARTFTIVRNEQQ